MRQGEVFGLAVDDTDFLRRVVHVRRQVRMVDARLVFAPPKGGRERDVPLPESVSLSLAAHIAQFALNRNYVNSYLWKPALEKAGVLAARENGFHALRHYFASACLHNGADIRALAEYLGHHDPGFTLRTYVHLMPDAGDRMRAAVDRMLGGEADGPATARGARR